MSVMALWEKTRQGDWPAARPAYNMQVWKQSKVGRSLAEAFITGP